MDNSIKKKIKKRRNKVNSFAIILVLAILSVIITGVYIYFSVGYRYKEFDNGIRFVGKYEDGKPVSGDIYYPDNSTAKYDAATNSITYSNGDVYTGAMLDFLRNGKGLMTYKSSGDTYEGDFVNDELTGKGKFVFSNGDTYEGDVVNGKRQGYGTYKWADGSSYEGEFSANRKNGKGTIVWADGSSYVGDFVNDVKSGTGTYLFSNGDVYVGDFAEDRRTGHGTYTFANGEKYIGEFLNNKFHGKGLYVWPADSTSGERSYEGDFENGLIVVP